MEQQKTGTKRGSWTRRALLGAGAVGAIAAGGLAYLGTRKGGAIVRPGVSRAHEVDTDMVLPRDADVVVVGGGIVGTMTALSLAERGLKVVLCEKGVVAGEASGRSLGYIDSQFLDAVKMPLIARSKELWAGLSERIGADCGYRQSGLLTLFASEEGVEGARQWLESVSGAPGMDARVLASAEAQSLYGSGGDRLVGGLYQPSDGIAEPELAAPAVAARLRQLGGVVVQGCAVRGFETTGGQISAAVTELGTIRCTAAVIAGGVWSPVMARSLGLDLPQFMAFGSVMRFSPTQGPAIAMIAAERGVVMRRNRHGGYDACMGKGTAPVTLDALRNIMRLRPALENMGQQIEPVLNFRTFFDLAQMPARWELDQVTPFEQNRVFMPERRDDELDKLVREAPQAFPFLAGSRPVERWAGALTSTPDNMPVLSAVEQYPGLFVGSGFYYGLTMGPAAGEYLADLVTGTEPAIDLSLYRLGRFAEGAPIVFRA